MELEEAKKQIRVLLAEDLALVRQGIRSALGSAEDLVIVGEAENGDDAVRLARELDPHVVLMDQDMPESGGLEATRMLKHTAPYVEVIIMTDHLDDGRALQAIEAGATGYIHKDIPGSNMAAAIRSVYNGRAIFHPEVTRKVIDRLAHVAREHPGWQRLESEGLTERELGILGEVAKGRTDREVATLFAVGTGTVKTHIRHILRKLSVRNRAQAVAYALRKRLIQ